MCAVSWTTWPLFTGARAPCVVLCVRCPGLLGSCSPVCTLRLLCFVCGVLGPLGSCSPEPTLGVLCCLCGALVHLAPVHRWQAPCVVLCVRCPGPHGSCSPVRPLRVVCCVGGVMSHLAPVHRCARSACCVACALSSATWLLFTGVLPRSVVLCVVCGVLGHLAPVHRCAHCVCCVACAGRRCGVRTHPCGRPLFVAGRGLVPSWRAHVHPDGGCFVGCRGRAPSGRAHVHPDGGCSVAGRGWVPCWVPTRPFRRRRLLPGNCSRAVV